MTATSIELAAGRPVDRGEVAAALYNAMDRWYEVFCHEGTASILQQARRRTATLGRPVTVLADDQRWQGIALDLDTDGALLVRDETGAVRRVLADDVSIRYRPLKTAHLLRWHARHRCGVLSTPHSASLAALHLDRFERPGRESFRNLLSAPSSHVPARPPCVPVLGR